MLERRIFPYCIDSFRGPLFHLVQIALVELCTTLRRLRTVAPSASRSARGGSDVDGTRSFASRCCRSACWSSASMYGLFMFGLGVTSLITEIGKLTIGRLRPHFIDVCRPDVGTINCSTGFVAFPSAAWAALVSLMRE